MRRTVRALPALILTLAACADSGDVAPLRPGATVPDYAAASLAGDTVSLASLRGEVVLLNVWATWCIPCREEMPALQRLHAEKAADGLRIVGVSIDAPGAEVGGFAEDMGVGFTILHDPESRVTRAFRTIGVPESFLVSRDGVLLHRWIGPFDPADPANAQVIEEALAD